MEFLEAPILGVVFLCLVGLAVLVFVRTSRIEEMGDRLDRLERRLAKTQRKLSEIAPPVLAVEVEPLAEPVSAGPAHQESREQQDLPRRVSPSTAIHWEAWIGQRALGWLAVLLLLFAVGFFLKYAFENKWIGPLGRVMLGMLGGVVLVYLGLFYHRRGAWFFSQMLTAAGAVLLYLTTWAAFGFYDLLPREHAAVFLVILVLEIAGLALVYNAMSIALMAVVGGLITPLLLASEHDQYQSLFIYLALLNLGVVVLILVRHWPVVGTVALVGSQLLFMAWMGQHFHPEKRFAALVFQGVLLCLYTLPVIASTLKRRLASDTDLIRLVVSGVFGTILLHVLLYDTYRPWLGTLGVGLSLLYALLAWLISSRHAADARQLFVLMAMSLSLIATAFAWQADVAWIAVSWAVEGAALWWFGLRIRTAPLRVLGAVFLTLALGRLLAIDTPYAHTTPFVPIFNSYALPALSIAACIVATAVVSRYSPLCSLNLDRLGAWMAGILGVLLIWFILSFETYTYFTTQIPDSYWAQGFGTFREVDPNVVDAAGRQLWETEHEQGERLYRTAGMALSLVWTLYAGVLLALGFLRHNLELRATALGLFGLTLLKVVFVDMAELPGLYRVAVFFALALVLGVATRIYQRYLRPHLAEVPS